MIARLCFLLKKIISFPTATQENIEKSFVFPDPLILALLFSHTCPRASLSGLENTCGIQKIFRIWKGIWNRQIGNTKRGERGYGKEREYGNMGRMGIWE